MYEQYGPSDIELLPPKNPTKEDAAVLEGVANALLPKYRETALVS
jgi:hypothetical protein